MRKNKRSERLAAALAKSDEELGFKQNTPEIEVQEETIDVLPRRKFEGESDRFTQIPPLEKPISQALYDNIVSDRNATFSGTETAANIAQQASGLQADINRVIDNAQLENNAPEGTQIVTNPDGTQSSVPPKQEQPVGNAMSKISQVVAGGNNEKPSYINTTNADEVGNVVVDKDNYYNNMRNQVDPLVVEQLGVQDYYPDISRNIGVGTFTGKRIGSQTVYAGGGVLLPMGLYDARLRALDKKAKDRQVQIDKLREIPSVPDQFKDSFNQNFMSETNKWIDAYQGNYDALKKDRNFQKYMQHMKDKAAEITYTDKYINGIVDQTTSKDGSAKWVPEWMMKKSYEWKSAMMDDVDDIVSGKKNVLPLVNQIRSYENGTKWADDFAKQNFTADKMGQTPLVFKQGSVRTPQDEKDYADFVQAVKGRDYDRMITGFKKFYDTSALDSAIEAAFKTNNFDKDTMPAIKDYLLAQVPQDKIEMKQDVVQNENFERQQEANKNYWKRQEFDLKVDQGKTHFTSENELMNSKGPDGKTLNEKLTAIKQNKKLDTTGKINAMKQAFNEFGREGYWDKSTRTFMFKQQVSPEMQATKHELSTEQTGVKVRESFMKNGKKYWVEKALPVQTILERRKYGKNTYETLNGHTISEAEFKAWEIAAKRDKFDLVFSEVETGKGFTKDNKKAELVTPENIKDFDPNNSRNISIFKGTASIETGVDGNGNPIMTPLIGDFYTTTEISDPTARQTADTMYGHNVNKKELSNAGGTTMSGSSTTQSE